MWASGQMSGTEPSKVRLVEDRMRAGLTGLLQQLNNFFTLPATSRNISRLLPFTWGVAIQAAVQQVAVKLMEAKDHKTEQDTSVQTFVRRRVGPVRVLVYLRQDNS